AELGRERALERDAVSPHGLECVLRERRAVLCHRRHADVMDIPLDLDAGRFDRTTGCLDDLRARAITRNERDRMRQDALPLAKYDIGIVLRHSPARREAPPRGGASRSSFSRSV